MNEHRLHKIAFQADMRLGLGWFAGIKGMLMSYSISMSFKLTEYDISMPWYLGEVDLFCSCHALKEEQVPPSRHDGWNKQSHAIYIVQLED